MDREAYEAGLKDAIMWLLEFSEHYKPEYLARRMQAELLPNEHTAATTPPPRVERTTSG